MKNWKVPICTQLIRNHTAESFRKLVESLYEEIRKKDAKKKKPKAELALKKSTKGGPLLTVRRKPKVVTYAELEELSLGSEFSLQDLLKYADKKKIHVEGIPNEQTSTLDWLPEPKD